MHRRRLGASLHRKQKLTFQALSQVCDTFTELKDFQNFELRRME